MKVLHEREKALTHRVTDSVGRFAGFTHVMVVGGGASLVAGAVKQATGVVTIVSSSVITRSSIWFWVWWQ